MLLPDSQLELEATCFSLYLLYQPLLSYSVVLDDACAVLTLYRFLLQPLRPGGD
jgi:hypothetical protein